MQQLHRGGDLFSVWHFGVSRSSRCRCLELFVSDATRTMAGNQKHQQTSIGFTFCNLWQSTLVCIITICFQYLRMIMQMDTVQSYNPPTVVQSVAYLFGSLSQSVLVMFTNDHDGQAEYIKGILGVATILFSIWLVWSCLLLMFRGANCDLCCTNQTSNSSKSTTGSTDESLNEEQAMESTNSCSDDESSMFSFDSSQNHCIDNVQPPSGCQSFAKSIRKHAHWILRFGLLFSSLALISSSVLVLGKASFPAISAMETTDHLMEEAQLVFTTTQRAIRVIQETSNVTTLLEAKLKQDLIGLCPDLPHFYLVHELGVDPYDLVLFLHHGNRDFSNIFDSSANRALGTIANAVGQLQAARDGIQVGQDWIWILPLLMLCMSIFTLVFILSVFWAMLQERLDSWYYADQQEQWEKTVSWAVVPVFAILAAVVWAAAIALSTGAIVVTDICLPTPDENILFLLRTMDDAVVTPRVLDAASAYMTGCFYDDPLDMMHAVEGSLNGVLGIIDHHLQDILSNGYGPLDLACGPNNKLDSFFASVSQLSYYLRNAHGVVLETHAALDCDHLSGLYHSLFHDALCSEFASAVAYGFILVFTVAIASLQILTFRGACNYVKPRVMAE